MCDYSMMCHIFAPFYSANPYDRRGQRFDRFEMGYLGLLNFRCVDEVTNLNRLSYFHLILVLFKWLEFYDKYLSVIPDDLKDVCRALMSKLKTRDVE